MEISFRRNERILTSDPNSTTLAYNWRNCRKIRIRVIFIVFIREIKRKIQQEESKICFKI